MPQVYVFVYSSANQTCLIAEKKQRGFYFSRAAIAPAGQILNYSGQDVLPGGALQINPLPAGENPQTGAIREFNEETGVALGGIVSVAHEVRSFNAQGNNITGVAGLPGLAFHCLYFNVSAAVLAQMVITITNNLALALPGKMAVVADDELARVFTAPYPQSRNVLTAFVNNRAAPGYAGSTNKGWFGSIMDARP